MRKRNEKLSHKILILLFLFSASFVCFIVFFYLQKKDVEKFHRFKKSLENLEKIFNTNFTNLFS
jgi:hypothetical protein